MFQAGVKFVSKLITGSTGSASRGIAALCHEIGNDTMENNSIIKTFPRQEDKIIYCLWRLVGKQPNHHCPFICFHARLIFLLWMDQHFWWFRPLFSHSYFS